MQTDDLKDILWDTNQRGFTPTQRNNAGQLYVKLADRIDSYGVEDVELPDELDIFGQTGSESFPSIFTENDLRRVSFAIENM